MIWLSTAMILTAFAAAALAIWFAPLALGLLGPGEFVFVGQVCFAVVALSFLEAVFARLPGGHETGHEPPGP
jgi:hypothetical protein